MRLYFTNNKRPSMLLLVMSVMQAHIGKGIKVLSITTQTTPLPPAVLRDVQAFPGSCCTHTAPAIYQSSPGSQTTTDHPVTPEFVPKPPPVLAGLKKVNCDGSGFFSLSRSGLIHRSRSFVFRLSIYYLLSILQSHKP